MFASFLVYVSWLYAVKLRLKCITQENWKPFNAWCHRLAKQAVTSYCLHAGAVGSEAEEDEVRTELEGITDAGIHSDQFPVFQLIPKEMLQNKGKNLKLLPNNLGQWHTQVCQLQQLHSMLSIPISAVSCKPIASHFYRALLSLYLQQQRRTAAS